MTETLVLATVASLIPTMLYVGMIYWADQYEKEPAWLLTATFGWGAIPSILLVLWLQAGVTAPLSQAASGQFGLFAGNAVHAISTPLIEETVKAIGLLLLLLLHREEIDAPLDGIIYGAMVGMGFGMVENIMFFRGALLNGGLEVFGASVLLRGVMFGLIHALFSSLVGLGFALYKLKKMRIIRLGAPFLGWTTAVFLHFIHNASVELGGVFIGVAVLIYAIALAATLLIVAVALWNERKWIRRHLREEVQVGLLTIRQYHIAASRRQRNAYLWQVLVQHGFGRFRRTRRFYHAVSRLAYRKHYRHMHVEFPAEIEQLRAEIRRLNAEKIVLESTTDTPARR